MAGNPARVALTDELLWAAGAWLSRALRAEDLASHFGGDESACLGQLARQLPQRFAAGHVEHWATPSMATLPMCSYRNPPCSKSRAVSPTEQALPLLSYTDIGAA